MEDCCVNWLCCAKQNFKQIKLNGCSNFLCCAPWTFMDQCSNWDYFFSFWIDITDLPTLTGLVHSLVLFIMSINELFVSGVWPWRLFTSINVYIYILMYAKLCSALAWWGGYLIGDKLAIRGLMAWLMWCNRGRRMMGIWKDIRIGYTD